MKKIEREPVPDEKGDLYIPDIFCVVKGKDLDALEIKLQEALKVLIKCQDELRSMGHESIALNMESSSPLLQKVRKLIKAISGKSWQEAKTCLPQEAEG